MDKATREKCEERIYNVMDTIDPSGTNSEYYRKLFAKMSDTQFLTMMKNKFPFRFYYVPGVVEPTDEDCDKALKKYLNSSIFEKLELPYFYTDANGHPVTTHDCFVGYTHIPKVQQMIVKKNKNALNINNRDMKTGKLNADDKGAIMSDRELESLATLGLDITMNEFFGFRADSMEAKNTAYNQISNTGLLSMEDVPINTEYALSKQLMNAYMIGAHINSNVMNVGMYTQYTLKNKKKEISRGGSE